MLRLGFVGFDCVDCDFGCFDDYHRKSDLFLLALVFVLFCFFFVTLLFLLLIVRYLLELIFFPTGNG